MALTDVGSIEGTVIVILSLFLNVSTVSAITITARCRWIIIHITGRRRRTRGHTSRTTWSVVAIDDDIFILGAPISSLGPADLNTFF